ncbi:hypothetical protein ACS25C_07550 [Dickeya undicola]|nr:hypothetical protein [Dickeya undicola]
MADINRKEIIYRNTIRRERTTLSCNQESVGQQPALSDNAPAPPRNA